MATDELAPLHAVPKGRDPGSSWVQLFLTLVLAVLVVAAGYIEHVVTSRKFGALCVRLAATLEDTLAFTTGWCLLTLIKLTFWSATNDNGVLGEGDVMTSHVVMVLICSTVTFAAEFMVDFVADRAPPHFAGGMRALGESFMLLLGLAWEGAFWEGAHAMAVGMKLESKSARMGAVILMSLSLCAVVMPAWIIYIMPSTLKAEHHEHGHDEYDEHHA